MLFCTKHNSGISKQAKFLLQKKTILMQAPLSIAAWAACSNCNPRSIYAWMHHISPWTSVLAQDCDVVEGFATELLSSIGF
jgi:hypothetical protein